MSHCSLDRFYSAARWAVLLSCRVGSLLVRAPFQACALLHQIRPSACRLTSSSSACSCGRSRAAPATILSSGLRLLLPCHRAARAPALLHLWSCLLRRRCLPSRQNQLMQGRLGLGSRRSAFWSQPLFIVTMSWPKSVLLRVEPQILVVVCFESAGWPGSLLLHPADCGRGSQGDGSAVVQAPAAIWLQVLAMQNPSPAGLEPGPYQEVAT